jgi:hypothetical protein
MKRFLVELVMSVLAAAVIVAAVVLLWSLNDAMFGTPDYSHCVIAPDGSVSSNCERDDGP